jgi:methanogenic corrinoid protein MtbC1
MTDKKKELLGQLSEAVVDMDDDKIKDLCKEVIDLKMDVQEAIFDGLTAGMQKVKELYENEEYALPELLVSSETFEIGMNILKPHLDMSQEKRKRLPNIIIGTVEGDIHSIGKNLVKLMLSIFGFDMTDVGIDANFEKFSEAVSEKTRVVALSSMMTTTLQSMKDIIDKMRENYPDIMVIIGGASVTKNTVEKFGVDGFGTSAFEAVSLCKDLLEIED